MTKSRCNTATAVRLASPTDAEGLPPAGAWGSSPAVSFCADWQGKNLDAQRKTEVRLLWTPEILYLRFQARYRLITVFSDAPPSGRRDHLWERDVCEVFLQPDPSDIRRYKEFEVSPNGFWIDLDIAPGEKRDLQSGLRRRVRIDRLKMQWEAILAIPVPCLIEKFDPAATWKVNFYRVEGSAEPRFYAAWMPTHAQRPDFHVPRAFGNLIFAGGRGA